MPSSTPSAWMVVLLKLFRSGLAEAEELFWPFGNLERLLAAAGSSPLGPEALDLLHGIRDNKPYSLFQLKQVRDTVTHDRACYTAIVDLQIGLDAPPAIGLLPPAVIDLETYASAPYRQELGLRSIDGMLLPVMPYWIRCNFSIKDPKILYSESSRSPAADQHFSRS